ncbi:transporter [Lactobacillus kefiranofaciens]|uniref:Transporter n=1 Tax=Lactobacillus kefiranofaciens TaxID=267818 RepID=A0AAX3UF02_9LACO|nr:transporter [Lactobacillus kefiranofaciens]AEG40436.1 Transporter protein [Lactobacillus kefiranofaciens subsp. kefiranofaciens]MCJ2172372.1 transporter [Lactobacillus kefiranofaciens]MCP9329894.1 transporter [Lactobacillus kefiranofaciens]MDF4142150.1 transporter [Lactobacillus kefiranofaciens]PAK98954.1 transporter [Lactobacillus kefiranofaciens]
MKKSKYDIWIGAINLINCLLFIASWFAIFGADFTTRVAMFFYLFAWIGVIINAIAVVQSHNLQISLVGPILGVVGNALYGFTAVLALPAVIVNIVSAFFIFMQHVNHFKTK